MVNANEGLPFGPEWTFTGPGLIESDSLDTKAHKIIQKFADTIMRQCPTCRRIDFFPEIEIEINNEVTVLIGWDEQVIEINSSPMNVTTMKKHEALIEKLIWGSAKEIGLQPHFILGAGHIHVQKPYQPHLNPTPQEQLRYSWHRLLGLPPPQYFSFAIDNPDVLLMRNFVVELWNTPELFLGALGFNSIKSKPLSALPTSALDIIAKKVLEFDQGDMSIESLIRFHNQIVGPTGSSKNVAVNLEHPKTIEVRGIRPQKSFSDYIKICELLENKIHALVHRKTAIPLQVPLVKTWFTPIDDYTVHHSSMSNEQIIRQFRNYVESANLPWNSYSHLPLFEPENVKIQKENSFLTGSIRCSILFTRR